VGVASDGKALSVLAPRVEGQALALRQAYEQSGIAPRTIGLIEAHGTATGAGDVTEIRSLTQVFGARDGGQAWCGLGTIKSMIGHTMPAAGAAGLIKATLALYQRTLPPTINVGQPNPALELEHTPFYINTETRPWVHGAMHSPRRAGVNAFGFGGINAHVILEEYPHADETSLPSLWRHWDSELVVVCGDDRAQLLAEGRTLQQFLQANPGAALKDLAYTLSLRLDAVPEPQARLAIVADSIQDLQQKLERALGRLAENTCRRIKEVGGVYFFEQQLGHDGKLAFLFPGEGAQYVNMLADLCMHFPHVRACFDEIDRVFQHHERGYLLSDIIFPQPAFSAEERTAAERRLWQMDVAIEALTTANHALHTLLIELGIIPHAIVGHSTGEFSAMRAAGMLDLEGASQRTLELNRMYSAAANRGDIPVAMLLSVGASREQAEALAAEAGGEIYAAMDNCPHQVVLVGSRAVVTRALALARPRGIICEVLPFDRAYHTPLYAPYAEDLRAIMSSWIVTPPLVPLYSCTTIAPFPADLNETRRIAHEHWMRPVEFRRTVERMYDDGVRVFVEVGPRGNLSSFVEDTLRGRPVLVVPANVQHRSGITQLNHLLAQLAAHRVPLRLAPLYARRAPTLLSLAPGASAAASKRAGQLKLSTGWPPISISDQTATSLRTAHSQNGHNGSGVHTSEIYVAHEPAISAADATAPASNGHPISNGGAHVAHPNPAAQQPPTMEHLTESMASTADQVMSAYIRTMDQFLLVQQEVMGAYLAGVPAPTLATPQPVLAAPLANVKPDTAPIAPATPLAVDGAAASTAVETPPTSAAADTHVELARLLLQIVSEKTGYPLDMLDIAQDLEADLGIDSIKRVEILGALQQQTGMQLGDHMDQISALRTIEGVIDLLVQGRLEELDINGALPAVVAAPPAAPAPERNFPFLQQIVAHIAGQSLHATCELSLAAHPFLRDHTLGRNVALLDPELTGLAVMPLTMTMELLAEAAAAIIPEQRIVGMREVRGYRWITFEAGNARLQVRAERTAENEVHAQIELLADSDGSALMAEATTIFAPAYDAAPMATMLALREEQPSRWLPAQLYDEAMFHGPLFRGVYSIERIGTGGAEGRLETLPQAGLFDAAQAGPLLIDPVTLDQPGQIVGFWAAQLLEHGYLVFPFRLQELRLYGPTLPPHERLTCQAQITLVGEQQVSSDLDIVTADGRVWARFVKWEDRRFDIPRNLYRMLTAPGEAALSERWDAPRDRLPSGADIVVRKISSRAFPEGFFSAHGGIWLQVLTRLVLGQRELVHWRKLRTPLPRRLEWLMGRVAAKEAVRDYLQQHHGLRLHAADIEILPDDKGQPHVYGRWAYESVRPPQLSIAHSNGVAVALIAGPDLAAGVGIDIETAGDMRPGVEELAFTTEERRLLDGTGRQAEWQLRCWCAKEAVAKAFGLGMLGGPQALRVCSLDAEQGSVQIALAGALEHQAQAGLNQRLIASTLLVDDLVMAISLLEKELEHEL
jgi:acyl transferase domain-containing protein/phosphopantetheinyl transferase (holo-ACP synthase)